MERIATHALNQTLLVAALHLQTHYAEKQVQNASGLVSDAYGGFGLRASRLLDTQCGLQLAQVRADALQTVLDRLEMSDRSTSHS